MQTTQLKIDRVDDQKAVGLTSDRKEYEIPHRYNGVRYSLPASELDANGHPKVGHMYYVVILTCKGGTERAFFDYHHYPKHRSTKQVESFVASIPQEDSCNEWKSSFHCLPEIEKQIAALSNTNSLKSKAEYACIYVGISEKKEGNTKKPMLVGLSKDLEKYGNFDALESMVRNNMSQALRDNYFVSTIIFDWVNKNDPAKAYCIIKVPTGYSKTIFYHGNELYVRSGNTMIKLENEAIVEYIKSKA